DGEGGIGVTEDPEGVVEQFGVAGGTDLVVLVAEGEVVARLLAAVSEAADVEGPPQRVVRLPSGRGLGGGIALGLQHRGRVVVGVFGRLRVLHPPVDAVTGRPADGKDHAGDDAELHPAAAAVPPPAGRRDHLGRRLDPQPTVGLALGLDGRCDGDVLGDGRRDGDGGGGGGRGGGGRPGGPGNGVRGRRRGGGGGGGGGRRGGGRVGGGRPPAGGTGRPCRSADRSGRHCSS